MTTGTGVLCIFAGGFILCIAILAFIAFQEWIALEQERLRGDALREIREIMSHESEGKGETE